MILSQKRHLAATLILLQKLKICSDDQLDTLSFSRLVRFDKTKKISPICHRDGRHTGGRNRLHKGCNTHETVHKGEL